MLRFLYQGITFLLVPCALIKLWWRGRKDLAYRQRWLERLAWRFPLFDKPIIWLHAVSVGETIAAQPLIEALLTHYGARFDLLITNGTVNGSRRTEHLYGARVKHMYLPYDMHFLVKRFIKKVKPRLALLMETEVWPNVLLELYRQKIPTVLVNARLSEKSLRAYLRATTFFKPLFAGFTCIAAQASADAERFVRLSAKPECVKVVGNLKFNLVVSPELIEEAHSWRHPGQQIWLAASTHEGEEAIILAAYSLLRQQFPNLRLWLAPRHPERCQAIVALAASHADCVIRRSTLSTAADLPRDAIMVIDTLGELVFFYAAAHFCFVGGSLFARGGHNIVEPAAVGTPILTGASMYNFATIFEQFKAADALCVVNDSAAMVTAMTRLLSEPSAAEAMVAKATACFLTEQQALPAHMAIIKEYLED